MLSPASYFEISQLVGWALPTIPSTIFTHHSAIAHSLPVIYTLTAASLQNELVSQ
jgi:hypothetical protein